MIAQPARWQHMHIEVVWLLSLPLFGENIDAVTALGTKLSNPIEIPLQASVRTIGKQAESKPHAMHKVIKNRLIRCTECLYSATQ